MQNKSGRERQTQYHLYVESKKKPNQKKKKNPLIDTENRLLPEVGVGVGRANEEVGK